MTLTTDAVPIDLDRLGRWMDDQGYPAGPITDSVMLAGGTQNLILQFERARHSYVLRRPLPAPYRSVADWCWALGLAMADGAAAVGAVDHVAAGLGDLGRPDGFL
jgi:hypothetical protein